MLQFICGQSFQDFGAIIEQAFPPLHSSKNHRKNQRLLYRLQGKRLVLLKTNFCKKPKNPV
jgi:hypothetical protein